MSTRPRGDSRIQRWHVAAGFAVLSLALVTGWTLRGTPEPTAADTSGGGEQVADKVAIDNGPGVAGLAPVRPTKQLPMRPGEKRIDVAMDEAYTPQAPTGDGTDDYRCFVLDPELDRDVFITGNNVLPGNPDVVHHVIMFRVSPEDVADVEAKDDSVPGPGYDCFGDAAMGSADRASGLDDAPWMGAWAPGGTENKVRDGYGIRFPAKSKIVMQVHYNLLEDVAEDLSAVQLRVMDTDPSITPIHTYLTPGPVELPCRADKDSGPLCDRQAAVDLNKKKFGDGPGSTNDALHFLCNSPVEASETTACSRLMGRDMTILAAAGHMHLLGKKIKIQTNVGTDREETLLDIKRWDFDDQGARQIDPIQVQAGDEVTVTCTHSQELRDFLPEFADEPEKYVVWGQGTTDEMCLGILTVAFADESVQAG